MHQLLNIAAAQYSLFTRAQAHRCGVTDRILQRRVRNGLFEQLSRHTYRFAGSDKTWRQRVLAACFIGGANCVASHRTAAVLHGFDAVRPGVVEVTVPRGTRVRNIDGIVHESLDLGDVDTTNIGPIPVTTPARTLIDLGAVARWQRVEEAFDGAERDALAERDLVAQRHAQVRRQGRRGVGPMAVVLDKRLKIPPKWVIERRFVRLLESAGLPLPVCQYEVELPEGRKVYLDTALPQWRLAWELDGHGAHATRRQRAADNVRASAVSDLGWDLRRFTYEQVMHEGTSVVRAVRAALASHSCDS